MFNVHTHTHTHTLLTLLTFETLCVKSCSMYTHTHTHTRCSLYWRLRLCVSSHVQCTHTHTHTHAAHSTDVWDFVCQVMFNPYNRCAFNGGKELLVTMGFRNSQKSIYSASIGYTYWYFNFFFTKKTSRRHIRFWTLHGLDGSAGRTGIQTTLSLSLSLSLSLTHTHTHTHIYICIL